MKVFVAGATGVLGRGIVRQLVGRGHEVVGLVRDDEGQRVVGALGGVGRRASIFDSDSLARVAEGSEVVVHAATAIPLKARAAARDWELNDRIRREGTRALAECAALVGARLYVQQSIVWVATPADGAFFDEGSEAHPDEVSRSAFDGERIAFEAAGRGGFRAAVLRCGWFYGPDAGHTRMFGRELMKRRLPVVGRGEALWACLHTEDAARAFAAAAEGDREGLWHVVDDTPAGAAEVLEEFARQLGAPPPRRAPVWLARLVAGRRAAGFFTRSTHTSNELFRRDFGWEPLYPSYREGLAQVVSAWAAEGF
jgi:nucleoside-diphosphate-sugar epimerase